MNNSNSNRNLAIDMLRALTMTLMLFVNDFWKVHDIPQWMLHAKYGVDYMGLSDFVLPTFLFVVGMSVPYAIENRYRKGCSAESTVGHIFTRTLALLLMGAVLGNASARLSPDFTLYRIGTVWIVSVISFLCIWNAYPKDQTKTQKWIFNTLKVLGACALLFIAFTFRDTKGGVFQARWGILGNIGWTYIVVAFIYFFTRSDLKKLLWVWVAILAVCIVNQPLREEFGGHRIFNFPDPNFWDGFIKVTHVGSNTLMALGGVIVSVVTEKIKSRPERVRLSAGFGAAAACLLLGIFTHKFWIAAKIGITIPCAFFIYATAIAFYTLFSLLCDHGITGWYKIIKPAGTATLTVYMIPYVFYGFADITGIVLPDWLTHGAMSYVNCFCFALICIAIAGILEKMHIKLKI